ncbi:hypothetical protein [Nesterenkonia populi]
MPAGPQKPSEASYAPEPMATFIRNYVAHQELNTWEKPIKTPEMLQEDAKKRRHMKLTQIAGTHLLQKPHTIGGLAGNYTTLVSAQAQRAAQTPTLTQAYLEASEVPHSTRPTFPGVKIRIHVVGEEATGAIVRIPLFVIGDGSRTIGELLKAETARRKACEVQKRRLPKIDEPSLAEFDLNLETVPAQDQIVFLSDKSTGRGTVTVDVYEKLPPELVQLALDAMWAFPALAATTVEVLTPSVMDPTDAVVLNVEPGADLTEFLFPAYGQYRRVGIPILDHMYKLSRR